MENKIIPFPTHDGNHDPVLERALFFAELEGLELRATIPQAEANEAKVVY